MARPTQARYYITNHKTKKKKVLSQIYPSVAYHRNKAVMFKTRKNLQQIFMDHVVNILCFYGFWLVGFRAVGEGSCE
jgi:hypothetical protein